MNHKLTTLLNRPDIWQASAAHSPVRTIATGHAQLDQSLHHKGWPQGAITELLGDTHAIGEMLRLLIPALAQISRQQRPIVLISPPHLPYPPSLQQYGVLLHQILLLQPLNPLDQLWATEQVLRSGSSGALLSWLTPRTVTHPKLRKLQLAAQAGGNLAVLFRPGQTAHQPSPAALRIALTPMLESCQLRILKQRGGWSGQTLYIPKPNSLIRQAIPDHQLPVHKPEATPALIPAGIPATTALHTRQSAEVSGAPQR